MAIAVLILKNVVTTKKTVNTSVVSSGQLSGVSLEHFWDCLHLLFLHFSSGAAVAERRKRLHHHHLS